jgi:hypothetical protein
VTSVSCQSQLHGPRLYGKAADILNSGFGTELLDIVQINNRVDGALGSNRRAEFIVIGMAVGIFVSGIGALAVAYWQQNPYIGAGSVVVNSLLYWPIREVLKLRRDNLILQVLPVMLAQLSPEDAAKEIKKLADYLRGKA